MFEGHNLLEIRDLYNLSQTQLAKKLSISREIISKMEKGHMKVSKRTLLKLEKFLGEHPLHQHSGDVNILGKSSQGGEKKKSGLPFGQQRLMDKNLSAPFMVPLVGIKAQAGYVKSFEQVDYMDALEQYSLPPGVNPIGAIWRYFEIDGDSMEPTFSPGDVLLATMVPVEDWNDIRNFCVYLILTTDQLLVKRLYKKNEKEWVLISDNEEVAPQVLLPVESIKQLWQFRRHIRSKAPQPREVKITA